MFNLRDDWIRGTTLTHELNFNLGGQESKNKTTSSPPNKIQHLPRESHKPNHVNRSWLKFLYLLNMTFHLLWRSRNTCLNEPCGYDKHIHMTGGVFDVLVHRRAASRWTLALPLCFVGDGSIRETCSTEWMTAHSPNPLQTVRYLCCN